MKVFIEHFTDSSGKMGVGVHMTTSKGTMWLTRRSFTLDNIDKCIRYAEVFVSKVEGFKIVVADSLVLQAIFPDDKVEEERIGEKTRKKLFGNPEK